MRTMGSWGLAAALCLTGAAAVAAQDEWSIETKGAWKMRPDPQRDLLVMDHPWSTSSTGDFALVWRMMKAAEDWNGPVNLCFYCSDDYHTDGWRPDGTKVSAEGFCGHRFKQVLVDNAVVWSRDVSDPVVKGESPGFRVPIKVQPGQDFRLSLLVYDRTGSTEILEGDFYQDESGKTTRPKEGADPFRFMTHVYWGDFAMVRGETPFQPGQRPSSAKTRALHNERWPLPPFGDGWKEKAVHLTVEGAANLPKEGFPLQFGLPLPAGKVRGPGAVALSRAKGGPFFAQKTVLGRWPDESIRWLLADFPVTPSLASVDLVFQGDATSPPAQTALAEKDNGASVNAGIVSFDAAPGDLLQKVAYRGEPVFSKVRIHLRANGEGLLGVADKPIVHAQGPFRTTLGIQGHFEGEKARVASFIAYCSVYAGLPYLKLTFRIFNDTEKALAVSSLETEFEFVHPPAKFRTPGQELAGMFRIEQTSESARRVAGGGPLDNVPFFAAWDGGALAIHRFRELYPKVVRFQGACLVADLVAGGDTPIVFAPGEAKSHELWIAFGPVDPVALAAAVEQPPILLNPAYYCATGVLGPARMHDGIAELSEAMTKRYGGKSWAELGQQFGVRHFPDAPYEGGLPNWSNNYYERMLGLWSEWFMAGGREWYDRAVDQSRHILDTAVIQAEVPGADWLGAIHGPGKDHLGPPWNPALRTDGLDLYHKLTGDPEARFAVLSAADYCIRTRAGVDGSTLRQQAAPFDAICTAFAETGDPKYLDEGSARIESAMKSMDMRRGVWPAEHGSRAYRGNVPWMAAQMARPLYRWYRMTGDVAAAQLVVALAEATVCENTVPGEPGNVTGYSYNPHYAPTAEYDPLILPMIFAAYELTDDPFFLKAGTAQYHRWCRSGSMPSLFNTYWNTPWLAWYLQKYDIPPPEPEGKPHP